MDLMHLEFCLPNQLQYLAIFAASKMLVMLTVIFVGRVEDFVVHFPSISFITLPTFLASPLNFGSFSE